MAKKSKSAPAVVNTDINLNEIKSVEDLMKLVDARKTQLIVEGSTDFTTKLKAASESFATLSTEAKETIYKDKTIKGFIRVLKLQPKEQGKKDGSTGGGGDKMERTTENLLNQLPHGKDNAIAISKIAKSFKGGVNAVKEFVESEKSHNSKIRSTEIVSGPNKKKATGYYQHP